MPRIPVYEQTQVQTGNLPSPSMSTTIPNAGEGIARGLGNLATMMQKVQDEADTLRVEQAINELNKDDNALLYGVNDPANPNAEKGAFNIKGAAAFNRQGGKPLADEYNEKYESVMQRISKSLGNDNQRNKFLVSAGRMRANFDSQVRRYEQQQGEVYREEVYKTTLATENENASRNFDNPDALVVSMDRIVNSVQNYAAAKGLTPESTAQAVLEAQSNFHTMVMSRLIEEQKPLAAQAYFNAHKAAIDSKDASAARKALNVVAIDAEVSGYVDELVGGELGPQGNDRKPFEIDKMATEIRKKFKDNPAARDVALKMVKERKQEHDAGAAERLNRDRSAEVDVTVTDVWARIGPAKGDNQAVEVDKMIAEVRKKFVDDKGVIKDPEGFKLASDAIKDKVNVFNASAKSRDDARRSAIWDAEGKGMPLNQIKKLKEWNELDGTQRKILEDQIEAERKPKRAGATPEAIKEERDANYWGISGDPKLLAALSEDEIRAMTPSLGRAHVNKLLAEKRTLAGGIDGELEAKANADQIKMLAKAAGINVDKPKKADASFLGDVKSRAEEIIYLDQKRLKRPLDRDEKEKIYNSLLVKVPVRMEVTSMLGNKSIVYEDRRMGAVRNLGNVGTPEQRKQVIDFYTAKGIKDISEDMIARGIAAKFGKR
jgi:hypothetical protein